MGPPHERMCLGGGRGSVKKEGGSEMDDLECASVRGRGGCNLRIGYMMVVVLRLSVSVDVLGSIFLFPQHLALYSCEWGREEGDEAKSMLI